MANGSLYTSMAGLETAQQRLSTVSQNLANADTQGYAAQQTAALGLPYTGTNALPGADVISLGQSVDTQAGAFKHTGSPFDVAVQHGWLVVGTRSGGKALTRAGALAQAANGLLVTQDGNPVLNQAGNPISLPRLKTVTISSDGTITGIPAGAASQTPMSYGRIFLAATPAKGSLTPLGNSLYALPKGRAPTPSAKARAKQGYLEQSNVNPVETMINMISASKNYRLQTQVVSKDAKQASALDRIMMA